MAPVYLLIILLLLAAIYLLLAPRFAAWFYRSMLFHPEPWQKSVEIPVIEGIQGESVDFTQPNGLKLHAWFFDLPQAKYTILVSHGNRGNIATHDYLIAALLKQGVSVFMYDYSGYGASSGLPNLSVVTSNAEAAYDYLVDIKKLSPDNLILYGESLGAAVSAHLATVRKAKAIIYQSGFSSLAKIAREKMPLMAIYPKMFFPKPQLDAVNSFKKISIPVLIVHGLQDVLVPIHHAKAVFAAAAEPKHLVFFETAAHRDCITADTESFNAAIQQFFKVLSDQDKLVANAGLSTTIN